MPGSRTMFPAHWRDPRRRGMAEHLRVRNRETEPTLEPMPEATRFQSFSRSHNSYTGVAMRPVRPRRLAWTDYRPAEVVASKRKDRREPETWVRIPAGASSWHPPGPIPMGRGGPSARSSVRRRDARAGPKAYGWNDLAAVAGL